LFSFILEFVINLFRCKIEATNNKKNKVKDKKSDKKEKYVLRTNEYIILE